jgi:hypothetical protein
MELQQEKKDEMRQDMLETNYHERNMHEDEEYFMEWTIENFYFSKDILLLEAISQLREHCVLYDHDEKQLFVMMGEIC